MKARHFGFILEVAILVGGLTYIGFSGSDRPVIEQIKEIAENFTGKGEKADKDNTAEGALVKPEEAAEEAPVVKIQDERAAAKGLPAPPDIDITSWEYVLVNGTHTLDETFIPETGEAYCVSSSSIQDARIVDALSAFASGAEDQGLDVFLSSGYRSYADQKYLFDLKVEDCDGDEAQAATIVAIPGTSEHQSGLCCDITDIPRSPMTSELENTETYKWMYAHCAEYGFILRFPKDKEDITKIIYEPWHFRYVGKEAARYIMDNGLCYEEFYALYE